MKLLFLSVAILFQFSIRAQKGIVYNAEWENNFPLRVDRGEKMDTIFLRDIIEGKDKKSFLIDQRGDTIHYKTFKNKVVLLDFWFLNCKPCIAEFAGFDIIRGRYAPEDLVVLTVSFDGYDEVYEKLLSKRDFKFSIVTDTRIIGKPIYPYKLVIDRKANIRYYFTGGSQSDDASVALFRKLKPIIDKWVY